MRLGAARLNPPDAFQLLVADAINVARRNSAAIFIPNLSTVSPHPRFSAVGAYNNTIGILLDYRYKGRLNPDMVTGDSSTFDTGVGSWTGTGAASVSAVGGVGQVTGVSNNADAAKLTVTGTGGKSIEINFNAATSSGNGVFKVSESVTPFTTLYTLTFSDAALAGKKVIVYPAGDIDIQFIPSASSAGQIVYFDLIRVNEIPGNHVTQLNTTLRPNLVNVGGKSLMDFDGTDDILAANVGSNTYETGIFAGSFDNVGAAVLETVLAHRDSNLSGWKLQKSAGGVLQLSTIQVPAVSTNLYNGPSLTTDVPIVATVEVSATTAKGWVNGTSFLDVTGQTMIMPINISLNLGNLINTSNQPFNGKMAFAFWCASSAPLPASDLKTLERLAAILSGAAYNI